MEYTEIKGDLFKVSKKYVMAHCISKDAKMGAGIATLFRDKSSGVQYSLSINNHNQIGNVIPYHLKDGRKFYNLVTKEKYWQKPTYLSLTQSLVQLRNNMVENQETYLAIPKIGSGLDGLKWGKVRKIIQKTFEKTQIVISVFYL